MLDASRLRSGSPTEERRDRRARPWPSLRQVAQCTQARDVRLIEGRGIGLRCAIAKKFLHGGGKLVGAARRFPASAFGAAKPLPAKVAVGVQGIAKGFG